MELWNVKDLKPPPISSCIVTTKQIDIRLLEIALKEGVNFFENEHHLSTESALLSRSVYRFKTKFRSSKDFKSVEILNRVLLTYVEMRVPQMLRTLLDSVPQNYKVKKLSILTKNMMDYVLVRLQGLGKMLCKIVDVCKMVSGLIQQRLRLGHFWKIALVVFATTSRIFVVGKSVLKYTCELYTKLLPFSSCLSNSGVKWLPDDYCFPNRLDEWLNVDWLDLESNVIEILDDEPILSYLKLTDSDDDVEICDEYILVKDETSDIMNIDDDDDDDDDVREVKVDVEDLPESVIDLCQTCEIDVGEVVNVNRETKIKRKRKRNSRIDTGLKVGEGLSLSNNQQPKNKKRKIVNYSNNRKKIWIKGSNATNSNSSIISLTESPPKTQAAGIRNRKRKRKRSVIQKSVR